MTLNKSLKLLPTLFLLSLFTSLLVFFSLDWHYYGSLSIHDHDFADSSRLTEIKTIPNMDFAINKMEIIDHSLIIDKHRKGGHRKLMENKQLFDFTPFKQHHRKHVPTRSEPGSEIDPLYGVEKRLVPTGPNPLHH